MCDNENKKLKRYEKTTIYWNDCVYNDWVR